MKQFFLYIMICALCLTVLPAQASDSNEKKVTVYPSPVERGAVFKIEMPGDYGEVTVYLFNIVGKMIQTHKTNNRTIELNSPDVSGIYMVRLVEKQKVTVVRITVK